MGSQECKSFRITKAVICITVFLLLFPTLAVALISEKSELNVCHITLLDMVDVADFFATRSGDYAVPGFYDGGWEH